MNYFKVNCVGVIGKKVSMIEVECVQQRRLPYLQIIGGPPGAASALRERVTAALESAGFRLPARRFTVSVLGTGQIEWRELDLGVALAILGSAKAFSQSRMEKFVVTGALSLEGRLLPLNCRAPLRALRDGDSSIAMLLPWEDSHILGAQGKGGGFRTLGDVVSFLRREMDSTERKPAEIFAGTDPQRSWRWLEGRPVAQKILPVAAAGAHPLLVFGGELGGCAPLAEDLLGLLPPLATKVHEELLSLYRMVGEDPPRRPLRELRADQATKLLRFDGKTGTCGEISLAHGGLLLVAGLGDNPRALLRPLQEPIESGNFRVFRAGQHHRFPADWQLVVATNLCACSVAEGCHCGISDAHRWRKKLEEARFLFPLCYQAEERGNEAAPGATKLKERVESARRMAASRQVGPNHRLREEDVFRVKPWSEEAMEVWRSSRGGGRMGAHLARVALTVSDLRLVTEVGKADVLEARYYVPESFVPRSRSGSNFWSASTPEVKSSAMP